MTPMRIVPLLLAAALYGCGQPAPTPVAAALAPEAVRAAGASRANPVICVPGFAEPALLWARVEKHLEKSGRDVTVLSLFPHLASVEDGAKKLETLIGQVRERTGAKQVDLIAHSKGGLVARYYVKFGDGQAAVERLVAIASPSHGVPVPLPTFFRTIDQVKMGSPWMKRLNEPDETPGKVKYTTLIGELDPLILPHSTSDLDGAANHRVPRATHNTIMFSSRALEVIDAALAQ